MRVAIGQCFAWGLRETALAGRLHRIADWLARRGHGVTICCPNWWDTDRDRYHRNGVDYLAVTETPAPDVFATRLPGAIRRVGPDVIHVAGAEPWTVGAARVAGTALRAPVVSEWFGDHHHPASMRWRTAVSLPAAVVVPSRYVSTVVRELGASDDRVEVIPESINTALVRRIDPRGEADIIAAGPLDGGSNLEPLLLALAELRTRDWRASIIGDGSARADYEEQAADLRIDDRVSFHGALPRTDRIARYRQAHVFVQTAEHCPFPVELLWAMAAGCVGVVQYQADSAAHELVEGYPRGFRTTDDADLAATIDEAGSLSRRSYDDHFDRFDHSTVIESYETLYRTLVEAYGLF